MAVTQCCHELYNSYEIEFITALPCLFAEGRMQPALSGVCLGHGISQVDKRVNTRTFMVIVWTPDLSLRSDVECCGQTVFL